MRILLVSMNVAPWGGSEELWWSIADLAIQAGHEVMISVFRHPSLHPNLRELQSRGALIHLRPLPSFERSQHFFKRALAEIFLQLKIDETALPWGHVTRWKPEVMLFSSGETFDHLLHAHTYLIRYCKKKTIPFFMIAQRNWEWGLDVTDEFRRLRRKLVEQCDGLFFVSYHNFKMACMQLAMDIPNARIVQNPLKINLNRTFPYPDAEVPQLAYVARLQTVIKGQDLFLEAIASPRLREIPFNLRLYGAGPDHQYLQELINYHNLSSKVALAGHETSIEKVWSSNQLMVLCSLAEGTPLALKEAMACGRSALVTPVGDSGIWASETGFVARSYQVAALEAAFVEAIQHKNQWEAMGMKSKEKIIAQHRPQDPWDILQCLLGYRSIFQTGLSPDEYLKGFAIE